MKDLRSLKDLTIQEEEDAEEADVGAAAEVPCTCNLKP